MGEARELELGPYAGLRGVRVSARRESPSLPPSVADAYEAWVSALVCRGVSVDDAHRMLIEAVPSLYVSHTQLFLAALEHPGEIVALVSAAFDLDDLGDGVGG